VSLLLDALKKAEKAKEAAQRGDKKSDAPSDSGLRLEPTTEEARRVMTRDKLPDISTPLDIGSDDLSPRQAAAEETPAAALEVTPPPRPQAPARPATRQGAGNPAAQRAAAQSVFEAKFKEPNPRLPFYITVGVLGAFAIGTVVYFWIQLRPPPPLVNANPKPPAGELAVAAAKAPAPASTIAPRNAASAQPIPGLPGVPGTPVPAATQPAAAVNPTPLRPRPRSRPRAQRPHRRRPRRRASRGPNRRLPRRAPPHRGPSGGVRSRASARASQPATPRTSRAT